MDGMTITARFRLRNKPDRRSVKPGSLRIGGLITGPDYNGNLLSSGRERLLDQDAEQ